MRAKRPSVTRIRKFKELLSLNTEKLWDTDRRSAELCAVSADALCWASGCGCPKAEAFETLVLELAQKWEGHVIDKKGRKVDILKALATGKDR